MAWVRIDDHFDDHKKVEPLSDSAFRTFVESLCYSNRNLTDGFVEAEVAKKRWPRKAINDLLARVLWEEAEGGYRVHDYEQYQLTSEQILAERAAARERMQGVRGRRKKPGKPAPFNGSSGEQSDEQQPKFDGSSASPTPTPKVLSEPSPERAHARAESEAEPEPPPPIDWEAVDAYAREQGSVEKGLFRRGKS